MKHKLGTRGSTRTVSNKIKIMKEHTRSSIKDKHTHAHRHTPGCTDAETHTDTHTQTQRHTQTQTDTRRRTDTHTLLGPRLIWCYG